MADYAVVVGIGHYPKLDAVGVLKNLDGPQNDATAIADWLRDPHGGNVPEQNLKLIRSTDFPRSAEDPEPTSSRLSAAMDWLLQQTSEARADRLYLYFAGHGFAPVLEEPALFTAEASTGYNAYLYAYDWFRHFRQSGRFREYVLWMDCCMTNQKSIPVSPVMARSEVSSQSPGPTFIAVAAQTKAALEHRMPDGLVHGVFTWTLLQGLGGAAADDRGVVTARSLKSYLHDTMVDFLPGTVRAGSAVDLQPYVRAESPLLLKRLEQVPRFDVTLHLPAGEPPAGLRLWAGRPHRPIEVDLAAGPGLIRVRLPRGLYLAGNPDTGLRHGFQVGGAGEQHVHLGDRGPAVRPARFGQLHRFGLTVPNAAASLVVTNDQLGLVYRRTGNLQERECPGLYKVRVEFGRDIGSVSEHVLLLDRDTDLQLDSPLLPTPAPAGFSSYAPASQHSPFGTLTHRFADRPQVPPGQGAFTVLGRFWFHRSGPVASWPHPLSDLELRGPHGELVERLDTAPVEAEHDPLAPQSIWTRVLEPGIYYLRYLIPDGRTAEATVVVCPGWITQLVLQRESGDPGEPFPDQFRLHDAALFMRDAEHDDHDEQRDLVIESTRIALAQGRDLLEHSDPGRLEHLLLEAYQDPVAGIIGGYLLLRNEGPGLLRAERAVLFDAAVRRLQQATGGIHPDVQALSLRCADPALRHRGPITAPPVFTAGWELVGRASQHAPDLLPADLWQRIRATTALGPFFAWQVDERSRALHSRQLQEVLEHDGGRDLADRMALPRTALPHPPQPRQGPGAG
ncbi:caspase family protein [Glutamicibacter sp. MNS18]|uniref:caspase family protein n=1 Tax=Glutamicibacter sp. MNS18 TaxID=2989817 RepID=UPI0022357623|nr:caspase family protein [Glutamicibacter sp. MNS18]MCW4464801.1 caspase family protein [Glutamicibacter sp. MNS18]